MGILSLSTHYGLSWICNIVNIQAKNYEFTGLFKYNMFTYTRIGSIYYDGTNGLIHRLGIQNEFQGKGIGYLFLKHVLDDLKNKHISTAKLYVSNDNHRAINLYKKCGFVEQDSEWSCSLLMVMKL